MLRVCYVLCKKITFIKKIGMKRYCITLLLSFFSLVLLAQQSGSKEIFAFKITSYIVRLNDSLTTVQVQLPDGNFNIPKDQMGLLKPNYSNTKDTAIIGWGRCQLIKFDYNYFGIHLYNKDRLPKENDLIYTFFDYPANFKGRLYKLIKNAIYFDRVTEGAFYSFGTAASLNETDENALIDSLVEDIRFTGKEMLKQNNGQDQLIEGGIFNGKKLFDAMQTITAKNVSDFLDYVIARPQKYAGNNWKISETFATWMISKTPTVIKN